MPVTLGLDLDNTLVVYDRLFERLSVARSWVPDRVAALGKLAIRDHLRTLPGGEARWRELQALAYGPGMAEAELAPHAAESLHRLALRGITLCVVSHKTRTALLEGCPVDLHASAQSFLEARHLTREAGGPLASVDFEPTRQEKVRRIAARGCTIFVDDLLEVFQEEGFPPFVAGILYQPIGACPAGFTGRHARSWVDVADLVLGMA